MHMFPEMKIPLRPIAYFITSVQFLAEQSADCSRQNSMGNYIPELYA